MKKYKKEEFNQLEQEQNGIKQEGGSMKQVNPYFILENNSGSNSQNNTFLDKKRAQDAEKQMRNQKDMDFGEYLD